VICFNQSSLIFKRMIQHLAACGMLYVEKVVHEVVRTSHGVSALYELFKLFISKLCALVRSLDESSFVFEHEYNLCVFAAKPQLEPFWCSRMYILFALCATTVIHGYLGQVAGCCLAGDLCIYGIRGIQHAIFIRIGVVEILCTKAYVSHHLIYRNQSSPRPHLARLALVNAP